MEEPAVDVGHEVAWISQAGLAIRSTGTELRPGASESALACVANFSAVPHYDYKIGLPSAGAWAEVVNTDADVYGGSGVGNMGSVLAAAASWHGRPASATITIPPLAVLWLAPEDAPEDDVTT